MNLNEFAYKYLISNPDNNKIINKVNDITTNFSFILGGYIAKNHNKYKDKHTLLSCFIREYIQLPGIIDLNDARIKDYLDNKCN